MLILDYESLSLTCRAGIFPALCRCLPAWPEHKVIASTWWAREDCRLAARYDPVLGRLDSDPELVWLSDISDADLGGMPKWSGTLVPPDGPEAGRNGSAAVALAYAESRGSVAVLEALDNVEVALTVSPTTRVLWLPALLRHMSRAGLALPGPAEMLRALRDAGAQWDDDDLAKIPWQD